MIVDAQNFVCEITLYSCLMAITTANGPATGTGTWPVPVFGRNRDFVVLSVSTAIRPQLPGLPTKREFGEFALCFATSRLDTL